MADPKRKVVSIGPATTGTAFPPMVMGEAGMPRMPGTNLALQTAAEVAPELQAAFKKMMFDKYMRNFAEKGLAGVQQKLSAGPIGEQFIKLMGK